VLFATFLFSSLAHSYSYAEFFSTSRTEENIKIPFVLGNTDATETAASSAVGLGFPTLGSVDTLEPIDIVLIDNALEDIQILNNAASAANHIIVYDSAIDSALDVITKVINWTAQENRSIDSISILSHGRTGSFDLGFEKVTTASISSNNELWQSLGSVLSDDANIYIYGCESASGVDGQGLLDTLANAVDADVFGSDDVTGEGGDWGLEVGSVGNIARAKRESTTIFSAALDTSILGSYKVKLADTGYLYPTLSGPGSWNNPDNVFNDDNQYTRTKSSNQEYSNFNLGVPDGANIKGISLEADGITVGIGTATLYLELSWDGGLNWTSAESQSWFCLFNAAFSMLPSCN